MEEEKGFYWICPSCDEIVKNGDDIVSLTYGHMTGNTPIFHKYNIYHRECWDRELG